MKRVLVLRNNYLYQWNTNHEVIILNDNNQNKKKSFKEASNGQEKLENAVNSIEAKQSNLNQNHNIKKEALGPNTKR